MRTPEQEDSYELHVARDVVNQHQGKFVTLLAEALQNTDAANFELMRPLWRIIVVKYRLACDPKCARDGTGWTGSAPEWATA